MRTSKSTYRIYNGKLLRQRLQQAKTLLLLLPLILGLLIGALTIRRLNADQSADLAALAEFYVSARSGGWIKIFRNACLQHGGAVLFTVFWAFSLIGTPLILLMPMAEGLGLGLLSGYFYTTYHFSGVGYCLVFLYPAFLIAIAAQLLCCRDCLHYSKNAYEKAIRGRGETSLNETRIFLTKQFLYILMGILSAALEASFGTLFSRIFLL